ncbi:Competence protein ComM, partial [Haemophilus influenzae]
LSNM